MWHTKLEYNGNSAMHAVGAVYFDNDSMVFSVRLKAVQTVWPHILKNDFLALLPSSPSIARLQSKTTKLTPIPLEG